MQLLFKCSCLCLVTLDLKCGPRKLRRLGVHRSINPQTRQTTSDQTTREPQKLYKLVYYHKTIAGGKGNIQLPRAPQPHSEQPYSFSSEVERHYPRGHRHPIQIASAYELQGRETKGEEETYPMIRLEIINLLLKQYRP